MVSRQETSTLASTPPLEGPIWLPLHGGSESWHNRMCDLVYARGKGRVQDTLTVYMLSASRAHAHRPGPMDPTNHTEQYEFYSDAALDLGFERNWNVGHAVQEPAGTRVLWRSTSLVFAVAIPLPICTANAAFRLSLSP